jgi:hypothetical protein
MTKTFDEVAVGVIETENPVTSVKDAVVLVNILVFTV